MTEAEMDNLMADVVDPFAYRKHYVHEWELRRIAQAAANVVYPELVKRGLLPGVCTEAEAMCAEAVVRVLRAMFPMGFRP